MSYTLCGVAFLLWPPAFLNPWPMGIVFLLGEWAGGFILHYDQVGQAGLSNFLRENYRVQTD
jgi:hypothetical protein